MDYSKYFKNYTKSINEILDNVDSNLIEKSVKIINKIIKQNKRIFIIGMVVVLLLLVMSVLILLK